MNRLLYLFTAILLSGTASADGYYCPQNSKYINVGMSQAEVLDACGQPLSKEEAKAPVMKKIPVTQLVYTSINTGSVYPGLNSAFYQTWSLPSGTQGINITASIVDNKVKSFNVNGSDTNAMSMCQGVSIAVGDPAAKVYSACGSPNIVNNTYIEEPVPSLNKPQIWIYQLDKFHPPVSMTFLDGKLQSISQ